MFLFHTLVMKKEGREGVKGRKERKERKEFCAEY